MDGWKRNQLIEEKWMSTDGGRISHGGKDGPKDW